MQRRLLWLGHVRRMDDDRIPKDMLYGELRQGSRPVSRLRFKDVCKRDMKQAEIDPNTWKKQLTSEWPGNMQYLQESRGLGIPEMTSRP